MPLPAEQFLQPPPALPELFAIIHSPPGRGVAGTSTHRTNIQPFQQQPEQEVTQTCVQRTGSWEAAPHPAFPFTVLCDGHKSLLQPRFGQRTLSSQQTCPQSRDVISLFKRKEIADKTTYASLPLHDCNLQRASNKTKGSQCNVSTSPNIWPL